MGKFADLVVRSAEAAMQQLGPGCRLWDRLLLAVDVTSHDLQLHQTVMLAQLIDKHDHVKRLVAMVGGWLARIVQEKVLIVGGDPGAQLASNHSFEYLPDLQGWQMI